MTSRIFVGIVLVLIIAAILAAAGINTNSSPNNQDVYKVWCQDDTLAPPDFDFSKCPGR